jgi:hypothetical protein
MLGKAWIRTKLLFGKMRFKSDSFDILTVTENHHNNSSKWHNPDTPDKLFELQATVLTVMTDVGEG